MDFNTAKELVKKHINDAYSGPSGPMIILDHLTLERPYGWVFEFTSKKWLETQDIRHAIAGNGPVIFDRRTNTIHHLSSHRKRFRNWEAVNWKKLAK